MPRIKKIVSNRGAAFQIHEESVRWDNVKTAHDLVDDMEVVRILLNCYDLVGGGFLVWSEQAKIGLYTTLRLQHVTPEGLTILEEIKALGGWDSDKSPRRRKSRRQQAQVQNEVEDNSTNNKVRQTKKRKTGKKQIQVPKAKVTVKVKSEPEEDEREPELEKAGRKPPLVQNVTIKEEPIFEDVVDIDFDRYGLNLEDPKDDDYELEKESSSEVVEELEGPALSSFLPKLLSTKKTETAEMSKKERKKKTKPRPKQHSSTSQDKAKKKGGSERKAKLPRQVKPKGVNMRRTHHVYECRHCSVRKDTLNNLKDHFNEKHRIFNKQSAKESEKQPEGTEDRPTQDQVLKKRAFRSNCDVNIRILCVICSEILKYRNEHVKQHDWSDKGARKCDICDKVCYTLSGLYNHKREHKAKACGVTFDCKICGKSYSTRQILRSHIGWHSTERPHQCEVCGKAFQQGCALRKHKLIHAKTTPFICPHCGRGFNHDSNYRGHLRIHTGEKPYKCDICPAAFNHNVSLKSHKKSVHGIDMWKVPVNRRVASHDGETTSKSIAASIDEKAEGNHPNTESQSCNKSNKKENTAHNKAELQQANTEISSHENKGSKLVEILEKEKKTTSYSAAFSQYHNLGEMATKSDLTNTHQEPSNVASHTTTRYSSSEQYQPSSLVPMPVHHPLSHMPAASAGDISTFQFLQWFRHTCTTLTHL